MEGWTERGRKGGGRQSEASGGCRLSFQGSHSPHSGLHPLHTVACTPSTPSPALPPHSDPYSTKWPVHPPHSGLYSIPPQLCVNAPDQHTLRACPRRSCFSITSLPSRSPAHATSRQQHGGDGCAAGEHASRTCAMSDDGCALPPPAAGVDVVVVAATAAAAAAAAAAAVVSPSSGVDDTFFMRAADGAGGG
eukprot:102161-Chlamydomonas_euryale.AAC.1